jgi:endonuclease/exonuclease/phosphatase family metal-dependent hydrolase
VKDLCLAALVAIAAMLAPIIASSSESDGRLSVMSMNVHGLPWPITRDPKGRMSAIGSEIERRKPDLVFLQEVWSSAMLGGITSHIQSPYQLLFASGHVGPKGGLVIFLKEGDGWMVSQPPEFQAYRSSAPAWKVWQGDGLAGKGFLTVKLDGWGRQIFIVDTHLQSQYPGDDYTDIRLDQLEQLREGIKRLSFLPVLIAGDFNTDSKDSGESKVYQVVGTVGADLTKQFRDQCQCGTTFDSPAQWIDYILASFVGSWQPDPKIGLIQNNGTDDPFSDHQGLFATLSLPDFKTTH